MTNSSDNAHDDASAHHRAVGGEALTPVEATDSDQDALQVLLQASAAAESLQQKFGEFQKRQAEIIAERNQLNADRTAFESRARQFAEQVARDRATQREVTAEVEQRQELLNQLQQQLDQQREVIEEGREELDAKRQQLHEVVNEELARERAALQRQRTVLDEERQRLVDRTTQLEQQHGDRMSQIEDDLQSSRENMRDTIRKELSSELEQINRERQEWSAQKERQTAELQQQSEDLQQQRELFGEQLEAEQQRLRDEIEKRRQMLLTEQTNLQRRYRFQFEHLARAREDFESELRELRRDQQLFRSEKTRFDEQHCLRFNQLKKIHSVLQERDASLSREQKVVERERMSANLDARRQRERLLERQGSVMQDLESRARRLRQAEQASVESAQRVEQRLQHINRMRGELDSKQRDILEQRLLLEEIQAKARADGVATEGSSEVQRARKAVETFFEQLHQSLRSERDRLQEQSAKLSEKQEQFRKDRGDLEQWFIDKERELGEKLASNGNTGTHDQSAELEAELSRVRQRWHLERREAESTIRQLLDQIAGYEQQSLESSMDHRSAA